MLARRAPAALRSAPLRRLLARPRPRAAPGRWARAAAGARPPGGAGPEEGPHDIQFEDIEAYMAGWGPGADLEDEPQQPSGGKWPPRGRGARGSGRAGRRPAEHAAAEEGWEGRHATAPPVPDEELEGVDPSALRRDQLIWAVGRAATLGLSSERLWTGLGEAVATLGESQLTPAEVARLLQALAYAPREAPLDARQLQRLLKAFAVRAGDYSDERLMRVVYAYGKLAAKRDLGLQKFFDFVSSEVVERAAKLSCTRKLRILKAVWALPQASEEFRMVMVGQVMRHLGKLNAQSLVFLVPMIVHLRYHEREGVVDKLNAFFKGKLRRYRNPEVLLHSGMPLLLNDLLKTTTLAKWLCRLHDLQLLSAPPAGAPRSGGAPAPPTPGRSTGTPPSQARRVAESLEAAKLAELHLRHENPSAFAALPPEALHLLDTARRTPLEPPDDHRMPELSFVFAELGRLFRASRLLLHPAICGPYLLDLSDPLGRVVVEWDANWLLYPPWRRQAHEQFVRRKHRLLAAEGWRVLRVPLAEFQALDTKEAKLEYINGFAATHGLDHLRLRPPPAAGAAASPGTGDAATA